MNTMQAVMKMLEGGIVTNGKWFARIRDGVLGVTSEPDNPFQIYGDNVGMQPAFHGDFMKSCNNCNWTVYTPPHSKLFQRDLANLEKFNYLEHRESPHFRDYVYMIVSDGTKIVCINSGTIDNRSLCNNLEVYRIE